MYREDKGSSVSSLSKKTTSETIVILFFLLFGFKVKLDRCLCLVLIQFLIIPNVLNDYFMLLFGQWLCVLLVGTRF